MVLFSIIIPTYNRAQLITKTIDSVLGQTFKDYEIIVIDDKSTDNTYQVLRPYIESQSIRYFLNEQNYERARSRNRGIDEAKGKYISLLDSDDILFPGCLQGASELLSEYPGCSFFHCKCVFINKKNEIIGRQAYSAKGNVFKEIMKGNFLSNIGFFLLTETAKELRYDENPVLTGVEDYDFNIRAIAACGGIKRIDRFDCGLLLHPGRSVLKDEWDFTYRRTMTFMQKQLSADYFRQHYWPYRNILIAHLYLYFTAFLALRKKTRKAVSFLFKAFKSRPAVLFSITFWKHVFVIVKYAVSRSKTQE
jgi:glycosyltransferase involved in cell wall biosynthesis